MDPVRLEHDAMGQVEVPGSALYGAQTRRAMENFPISGLRLQKPFLTALGWIKSAAAEANAVLGELPADLAAAIRDSAEEVSRGDHGSHFVVDVFQSGSGTSTNMNANEVIAHLASGRLGRLVHPNDHVNRGQSSNDVIPTAIHVAAVQQCQSRLIPSLVLLTEAFRESAVLFHDVWKVGRTHLQDAVPMRLGDELSGYARQIDLTIQRIGMTMGGLLELPLGGTAVGTGLNAPAGFARLVIKRLATRTGFGFREAENHFEAQAAKDAVLFLSGALRCCAIAMMKAANDIRWLGSGPRCGLGELSLPIVQPGSSMMPGKSNPVIAESLLMVCAQVIGHDACMSWCCASGIFELNLMMPLIAYNLLDSIDLLTSASRNFRERCVQGLQANHEQIASYLERSLGNATYLAPSLGYDRAAEIAAEAHRSGRTIREVAREMAGIPDPELDRLFDHARKDPAGP